MKKVYILLTRSDTFFSKFIYMITRAEYTHASIALDSELNKLYSFGRKYKYSILPAGFIHESVNRGVMGSSDNMKCAVYRLWITDESYNRLQNRIRHMEANAEVYRYNILGLPMCYLHIEKERHYHYFCSQFVSNMLIKSGALKMEKAPSLIHPSDFQKLPHARRIFEGTMGELRTIGL